MVYKSLVEEKVKPTVYIPTYYNRFSLLIFNLLYIFDSNAQVHTTILQWSTQVHTVFTELVI